jgi:hypothetical protein
MAESLAEKEPVPLISDCCRTAHFWEGEPRGKETKLGKYSLYEASPKATSPGTKDTCILFLHDAFGWNFVNNRLFADRLSEETGLTVLILE